MFDPDDRDLCPDGACIGVLDDAGVCKVCGAKGARHKPDQPALGPFREPAPQLAPEVVPPAGDDDRELCPDGSCIGLMGADGRCKVCGIIRNTVISGS
jgi:hypothetical protein